MILDRELKQLIGDTRVVVALKKGSSIGNNVVRNKQLSISMLQLTHNVAMGVVACSAP